MSEHIELDTGSQEPVEHRPVEPPRGGIFLGNFPTDPDDPRFASGPLDVARLKEEYPDSTILVIRTSRDANTGGFAIQQGVNGIWKFKKDSSEHSSDLVDTPQ